MTAVGDLVVNLVGRSDRLTKELRKGRKEVKGFATFATREVSALRNSLLAGIGFTAIVSSIKTAASELDDLAKTSAKLGVASEDLAGLQFGAEQSGLQISQLNTSLQRMTRKVAEAAKGSGEARAAIAELGLSAADVAALSPDKQLGVIADAMKGLESHTDRVRLAFKLFDSEGVGMVNLLKDGSAGLREFSKEAESLGIAFSADELAKVEAMNDAINSLSKRFKSLAGNAAIGAASVLDFIDSVADGRSSLTGEQIGGGRANGSDARRRDTSALDAFNRAAAGGAPIRPEERATRPMDAPRFQFAETPGNVGRTPEITAAGNLFSAATAASADPLFGDNQFTDLTNSILEGMRQSRLEELETARAVAGMEPDPVGRTDFRVESSSDSIADAIHAAINGDRQSQQQQLQQEANATLLAIEAEITRLADTPVAEVESFL